MEEKLITLADLCEATGLSECSMRVYVCNYRFDKFTRYTKLQGRSRKCYILNQDFVNAMADFLTNRRLPDAIDNLKIYFKNEVLQKHD